MINMKVTIEGFSVNGAHSNTAPVQKREADLEEALDIVGVGWYNIWYCLVFTLFLIAAIVEMVGFSYVLTAARCDLEADINAIGIVASIPNFAIIISALFWGYMADRYGRKPVLQLSSLCCGVLACTAAFMPTLVSFAVCKLASSLFLSCPSSLGFAYIGEIIPQKRRDFAMFLLNALQTAGSILVPLFAWAAFSTDFNINLGVYHFRPWRLLVIVNGLPLLLGVSLMVFGPESPKYLVTQGRSQEALDVLRMMFVKNTGLRAEDFPVSSLKVDKVNVTQEISGQTVVPHSFIDLLKHKIFPIFKPPLLKWLILCGFLMFGVFSVLNGLCIWSPDFINSVLSDSDVSGKTACQILTRNDTQESDEICQDNITSNTFLINSAGLLACFIISVGAGLSEPFLGKLILLVLTYLVVGTCSIVINFTRQEIVASVLFILLQLSSIGIGPINAYAVQIFPTELRGMAVGLVMMMGRAGSLFGTILGGHMLHVVCEANFYFFGGLTLFCCILCSLLPRSRQQNTSPSS